MTNRIDAHVDPITNNTEDLRTREQIEQQEADKVIDRQQDVAGRRESAGQPGGDEGPESKADDSTNASQDAGWAKLSSPDGTVDLGRGRLRVWFEAPGSKHGVRHAQLSSFTPGPTEPRRGETVAICPEKDSEKYIATITEYDAVPSGESVVVLDWPNDELPASLRELGGE